MKGRKHVDKAILPADNVLRQMKPNTNSRKVFDRRRAVEALEKFRDFRLFDADTRISDYYFGIVFQGKKFYGNMSVFIRVFYSIIQDQQERELSMLQLRDIKHNMKNNLISILAYAENKEYEKMTGFIEEIMGEGGMVIASISNSGNIVIDSLIGYWYVTAQNKRIIFKTDICIPMIMPFKGADLSLILGNLLENAVEAAEKVEENRYINVKMKFDKNNLLLFVDNSYKGKLLKTRDNRLKSTKSDAENHGVGLASVYRAVAKYHGSVVIEDSEPGKFKIRIVLYSNVQE